MVTHQKPVPRLQKHPCSPRAQQVAKAVNNATEQSLVLIDEFGKGTNTVRRRMRTGMEDEGTGEESSGKGRGWMGRGGGVGQGRAGHVQKSTDALALSPHLCPLAGGRAGTSGCCAQALASSGTQLPPHLCGHQLPEPGSAAAAPTRTPSAILGEEVTPAHDLSLFSVPRESHTVTVCSLRPWRPVRTGTTLSSSISFAKVLPVPAMPPTQLPRLGFLTSSLLVAKR